MAKPVSLSRDISPPPTRKALTIQSRSQTPQNGLIDKSKADQEAKKQRASNHDELQPTLAAIEAGQAQIRDHLAYFAKHFSTVIRPSSGPRLSIDDFQQLYNRNQHPQGRHFVIHQHDHPISGVHYDLRLQFSESSTISFAIPYGLPGNPNSVRPNRMAIETRVHNLWNNLIESASHATGSLIIWDTGEYEVLDRPQKKQQRMTDDEASDVGEHDDTPSHSERLTAAFQSRHIHLRLNGTRLPRNYTIALRISSSDAVKQPSRPRVKRRRMDPAQLARQKSAPASSDTDSEPPAPDAGTSSLYSTADVDAALASSNEEEEEDAAIRANNAYPGATNTIGSIHQRHWFLTLDRGLSGFQKARSGPEEGRWVGGWGEAFYVRGREEERSVVTGRLAGEVMGDEGVQGFVGRGMWRGVLE